ncbi:hypothetical protein NMG60_11013232 [Bertholletia excelsa]
MILAIAVLAFLFLSGLLFTFFNSQTKNKFFTFKAWIQSSLFPNSAPPPQPLVKPTMPANKRVNTRARTTSDTTHLREVFAMFDKNKDGLITRQELRESLRNIGIHVAMEEVAEMVALMDRNGDGLIDMDEFCELYESVVRNEDRESGGGEEREEELREAFGVFDEDRDGLITVEELGSILASMGMQEGKRLESCKEMIKKVDMDGDGKINFEEFKRMMKTGGLAAVS